MRASTMDAAMASVGVVEPSSFIEVGLQKTNGSLKKSCFADSYETMSVIHDFEFNCEPFGRHAKTLDDRQLASS